MNFTRVVICLTSLGLLYVSLDLFFNSMKTSKRQLHKHIPCDSIWMHLFSNETVEDCITYDTVVRNSLNMSHQEILHFGIPDTRDDYLDDKRQLTFVNVFKSGYWGKGEDLTSSGAQRSGPGSQLINAQEAIAILHSIIDALKQKLGKTIIKLLDVPCGDWQWMHSFLLTRDDILYTGMDIVPELIDHHQKAFKNQQWRFLLQDAVKTKINDTFDVVLVRHVLQHLQYSDAMKLLSHISSSGSGYLLATTFPYHPESTDLNKPGGFRWVNLEIPPFSLVRPLCLHKDGSGKRLSDQGYLGMWRLPLARFTNCTKSKYLFKGNSFFRCL